MKIVKFYGGLGNQMFQYALLLALREATGEEVLMDTSLYGTYNLHNGFELASVFNLTAQEATREQIKALSWYTPDYRLYRARHYLLPAGKSEFREREYGKYYPEVFTFEGDRLYDGYWQHWEYFDRYRAALLREFTPRREMDARSAEAMEQMRAEKSCSLHVRRGDFQRSRLYRGICEADYYRAAVGRVQERMGEDMDFWCFSNDFGWCRENLAGLVAEGRLHFVDWNRGTDSWRDLLLMGACRANILANSSFSWWAAYLGWEEGKTVVAPATWINKATVNPVPMPEWIRI